MQTKVEVQSGFFRLEGGNLAELLDPDYANECLGILLSFAQ